MNVEADALSHIPRASTILIDAPAVKAIISAIPYTDHTDYNYNPSNIVCKLAQVVVVKGQLEGGTRKRSHHWSSHRGDQNQEVQ